MESSELHERLMRRALALAAHAAARGNHPVGALLASGETILLEAENTDATENDFTRHAELNLMVKAFRTLPAHTVRNSTLYTTAEPCVMCTNAIRVRGITRIVYSVSQETLVRIGGGQYKSIPCDEIYTRLGLSLELIGPVLGPEGLAMVQGESARRQARSPSILQRAKNLLRRLRIFRPKTHP